MTNPSDTPATAPDPEQIGAARSEMMREQLHGYDLAEEDYALLDSPDDAPELADPYENLPVLAIIGRPNVGKSTLVNRILGRRAAVVQDVPGVTRDRVSYPGEWAGKHFMVVDTGGWDVDVAGMDAAVAAQAEFALSLADAAIVVVDSTVGATHTDDEIVRLVRRAKTPVVLVANKVDSPMHEADAAALWNLGLGQPYPISALHGRGVGDALDAAVALLPEKGSGRDYGADRSVRRIAILGRPNVGKSSLLNTLAGEERVVVHDEAGTTRDPVDELVEIGGDPFILVDTAGIRRRVHQTRGADFYASLRTQAALEKAELALVLIDASQTLSEQDVRVIQQAINAGRAVVIVANKWDQVDEDRQRELRREFERDLVQLTWVPRINVSAKTGWHVNRLRKAIDQALDAWDTRITTGKLNAFLGELTAAHPHPLRGGKQPRILFATQADNRPPRFVIFSTGFIEAGYRRFIENKLRERFDFTGSPIEISVRVRERKRR